MNRRKNKYDFSIPQVMAILNVAPNSFSDVGRHVAIDSALRHVEYAIEAGATIIDVGGEATNPGVFPVVSLQEEIDRVVPLVEAIAREFPILISVDTSKPKVMQAALRAGMGLINDIRALREPGALEVAAKANIPVCIMHMAYPDGKPSSPVSDDANIIDTVKSFLKQRRDACIAAGIAAENIIVDPGIGHGNFGKTLSQNVQLLNQLRVFKELGSPILVGVSRKTFIGELLNVPQEARLSGSLAATVLAVAKGATIIRSHDVRETVEALKVAVAILHHS